MSVPPPPVPQAAHDDLDDAVAGTSRRARAALRHALDGVPVEELGRLADDLRAIGSTLQANAPLRHAVSDPSVPGEAKRALLERLLAGRVGEPAIALLAVAGAQRWRTGLDLVDAVELTGIAARLGVAEADGTLSEVEDELFRFGRILAREPQLTLALADPALPAEAKSRLVGTLLEGKASPITTLLVQQAVAVPRGLPPERAVAAIAELASQRRRELLAVVTSAVPLGDGEVARIAASLTRLYGRGVHVQTDVDPTVIGGVSVRVGDEIVDGSLRHRLAVARDRLTR